VPVVEVTPLEITRRARGLSQRQLADLAGVSRETISLIERGELPRVRTAYAIARALGVALGELLPINDETPAVTPGLRANSVVAGDRDVSSE
jgi:transcriptional regulator with XRE-family HTH domain